MSNYACEIIELDDLLNGGNYPSVRSLLSHSFLEKAATESTGWGNRMPHWYGFYTDYLGGENSAIRRLTALELVLSSLRNVPGKSKSRKDLEKRTLAPRGFAGTNAFFEVEVLAAGLRLGPEVSIEPYPNLPATNCKPEFSIDAVGRRMFFEATCFELKGKAYFPKSGLVLTRTDMSGSRLKTKFEDKRAQMPRNSPIVLLIGTSGIDPIEDKDALAQEIVEGARQHFLTDSLAAVLVFSFNPLSDPLLIGTDYIDDGANALTPEEKALIGRCFYKEYSNGTAYLQ